MGIKVSELAQELAQGLSEYSQEVADAIKKANIIEPIFEKRFIFHSYACRKGKGAHEASDTLINFVGYIHFKDHKRVRKDAMRRLKKLLKAFDTGEVELEDFDRSIESRFGHMKHADSYILIEETKEKVKEIKERKATA